MGTRDLPLPFLDPVEDIHQAYAALLTFVQSIGFAPDHVVAAYLDADPYALGVMVGTVRQALTRDIAPVAAEMFGFSGDQAVPQR